MKSFKRKPVVRTAVAVIAAATAFEAVRHVWAAEATTTQATTTQATTTQPTTAKSSGGWDRSSRFGRRSDRTEAAVVATTGPTGELTAPVAKPVPSAFELLTRRNIFIKGDQNVVSFGDRTPGPRVDTPTVAPEAQQVFTGTVVNGGSAIAIIEDSINHQIAAVKPGDHFNGGVVNEVSIDALTYTVNGKSTNVHVGQDMKGGEAAMSLAPATPTTGPSGAATESVLERMKRRREESMGGGAAKKP